MSEKEDSWQVAGEAVIGGPHKAAADAPQPAGPERALMASPAVHLGLSGEELTWAAGAHASILITLVLGIISGGLGAILGVGVPALIWYLHRDSSEYVVEQARQATIFQLAGIVGWLLLIIGGAAAMAVGWTLSTILVVVLIGLILLPLMLVVTLGWVAAIVVLPIGQTVYGCFAALEAYHGRPFRYRWIADLIDRYQGEVA